MSLRKNLLFVSAGDNTSFYKYWLDNDRNYDIYICYYGKKNKYKEYADYYIKRKGSKIQNFYYLWNLNENNIRNYENYYIVDDDIIIKTDEINFLFDLLNKYNLWMLQPSFNNKLSKISHKITKNIPNNFMRFTNFIEINTPFFSKYAITKCLEIYDETLVGYGIDLLFLWYLGHEKIDKYAIVDYIMCINPYNKNREIDKLQKEKDRISNWNIIKNKLKINDWKHKNYQNIIN